MLLNSATLALLAVVIILLCVILAKLRRVARYFYTPVTRSRPDTKYPPVPKTKPHHRRRNYGRKF